MRAATGWLVVAAGTALALRSALLLTGRGRPQRGPRPAFVVAGPYVRVRNPLYAGIVAALGGLALARGSTTLALVTAAVAVLAHLWVVRVEEPALRRRLGTAYAVYLTRVPRWLPGRSRRAEGAVD